MWAVSWICCHNLVKTVLLPSQNFARLYRILPWLEQFIALVAAINCPLGGNIPNLAFSCGCMDLHDFGVVLKRGGKTNIIQCKCFAFREIESQNTFHLDCWVGTIIRYIVIQI